MEVQNESNGPLDPEAIALISMSHNMTYSSYEALVKRARPVIGEYCDMLKRSWNSVALPFSENEAIGTIEEILKIEIPKLGNESHDSRINWSIEEEQLLESLNKSKEELSWKQIADEINNQFHTNRTSCGCEQRWNRVENPSIQKGRWTTREDNILIESMNTTGGFMEALQELNGRTRQECRRRWQILQEGN